MPEPQKIEYNVVKENSKKMLCFFVQIYIWSQPRVKRQIANKQTDQPTRPRNFVLASDSNKNKKRLLIELVSSIAGKIHY